MSKIDFRPLIRQVLREELAQTRTRGRLSERSVDDQIDSMLIQFESVSISESVDSRYSLMFLLEAEKGEKGPKDESDPSPKEDAETPEPLSTTSDKSEVDEPATPAKPPIDLDQFAQRVARLVENFSNLLDIPTVILTRTKNFVTENYSDSESVRLMEILDSEFSLSLHPADNTPERPNAVGAGPV